MAQKNFEKCDDKYDWYAYIRIGLYCLTCRGERINFCDIHLSGLPDEVAAAGAIYSGPKDSANQIKMLERTEAAKARYDYEGKVNSDLDLSSGGATKIVTSEKRKTVDIWLFGPLLFDAKPYGSLMVELQGFDLPKSSHQFSPVDKKTGKPREHSDSQVQSIQSDFPKKL